MLCSLTGMGKHPHAHNPPGRTPPAPEGTGSLAGWPLPSAGITGFGREDKATVTGRISGRSLALSGGSCSGDRVPRGHRTNFLQAWVGHGYTARLQGVRDDLSRCVPGRANRENSAQIRPFVNWTMHRLYFHPAHGGDL